MLKRERVSSASLRASIQGLNIEYSEGFVVRGKDYSFVLRKDHIVIE